MTNGKRFKKLQNSYLQVKTKSTYMKTRVFAHAI